MRLKCFECQTSLLRVVCFAVAVWMALAGAPAHANAAKHASMVIDANTGTVLHASNADEPRYPASLTKMMTLYLVFEEIERGRLSLDTKIKMTPWGAAAPPSKLGLKPGEELTVREAILALVTKSANDVARAVAEHIAGSEEAFARRMTEKARLLGMSKTTFRNASGLPHPEQVTTARDMLTLALRLYDDFEKHYHFFKTRQFTFRGRTYRNHNALLRTYPGMDGLKTGYIRMSGFNLVSSVRRGGKHVVAAVFGGRSSASRNAEMRALLDRTLPKASTKNTRKPVVAFYRAAPPAPVPATRRSTPDKSPAPPTANAATTGVAPARHVTPTISAFTAEAPKISIAKVRPINVLPSTSSAQPSAQPAPAIQQEQAEGRIILGRPPSTLQAQAEMLARNADLTNEPATMTAALAPEISQPVRPAKTEFQPPRPVPVALRPAPAPSSTPASVQETASGYQIQVGAYSSPEEAQKALIATLEKAHNLLAEASPITVPGKSGSRQIFRARFAGFDPQAARSTCEQLRRRKIDCFVTKSE